MQMEKMIKGLQLQGQLLWKHPLLRQRGIWMISSERCTFITQVNAY